MVRACLDGTKSQTRRAIKLPPAPEKLGYWEPTIIGGAGITDSKGNPVPERPAIWHTRTGACIACHFQPGDRLWVREAFALDDNGHEEWPIYRADGAALPVLPPTRKASRWRSPIHMPRWASRIDLEITEVRVERLQDISEADALAEGIEEVEGIIGASCAGGIHHEITGIRYYFDGGHDEGYESADDAYHALWDSLNGPGSWDANPWVWVITFKRVKP